MSDQPPVRPGEQPGQGQPGGRVLIVDDERAIANLLSRGLENRGFATSIAYSAEEAKRVLADGPDILVILSDIRMPGQDGLGLAGDVLRDRPEQQAMEVVLLTGNATAETALGALRTHVFDMVQKPFNLSAITQIVAAAMEQAQERRRRAGQGHQLQAQILSAEQERARLLARLETSSAAAADALQAREVSERARADLLAVVSHELRTPLIPVIGLAELLLTGPAPSQEELREHAAAILESGTRLLSMIDGALDIVAMDQGTRRPERRSFGVAELSARVAARAVGGKAAVVCNGQGAPICAGDVRLVERALDHLVANAVIAAPDGTAVSITWQAQDGGVNLAVIDRGPGVPADVLSHLGMPFVQADMSRGRRWPGAGLGLAFAHRVAAAHGGRLNLLPADPQGTRAELWLPGA